jgi:hypothetical protein
VIVTVNGAPAPVHSSVAATLAGSVAPPNPNAAVCVPAPPNLFLAVAILAGEDVQLVPSYSSVAAEVVVV